ncbi:MAG: S9 family peptidase [Sphingomonadales bacterium]|nr:S9 family peptidase [Sphingomonadales bacterium]
MRVFGRLVAAIALLMAPPSAVSARAPAAGAGPAVSPAPPPRIPTSSFTQRSGLSWLQLSPDGSKIALRAVQSGGEVSLAVIDAETRKNLHNLQMPKDNELEWFRWAGNNRIIVSMSQMVTLFGDETRFTRLFVYDLTSRSYTFVGKKDMGIVGDDVLYTHPDGEFVLLAMQRTIMDYPSVWRFPLDGTAEKNGKKVQDPRRDVWDWYADNAGVVRVGIEYLESGNIKVHYRKAETDPLRQIALINRVKGQQNTWWRAMHIVAGSDDGHVLERDDSGHYVLRKFNYATGTSGETLFARPGFDVDEVSFDDAGKLLSAAYTDDRERVEWFDPELKTLQTRLEKALKGSQVLIAGRARNRTRMMVWSGREDDPGVWYVYTAATKRLDILFAEKPSIDPAQMAKPTAITYKARDGVEIKGLLTLPLGRSPRNLPLIVLPHGGPYGVHDTLTFNGDAQFLANRGYAVLQPNYRGSSGYGDDFEKLGDGQIGRKMQDDLDDGMDWLVNQGLVDPKRVCMVGSSYGGYAALWAVIRNPERYRCAASFAGVTDWNAQLRYDRNFFSRESGKKWKQRISGSGPGFNLDQVSPVQQIARLTRPVLVVHGERDFNVPFKQYTALKAAAATAGKPIETLTFPDEGHGFDKQANEGRWLDTLEAFLTKHNPPD